MQQTAVHIDEFIITERLIAGDPGAQELVYDHYGPALYSIILQVVGDTRKAEEVLTKTFVKVFKNIHNYKESGNTTLFGWLMRMAREMAVLEAVYKDENEPGTEMVRPDSSLLQRFSNKLPAQRRTIFHLCYYKGLPKEAVARILGIQPEEVMSQLRETMVEFRKFLGE
ncbi:RNA polymerase sigma factor [Chitinophaga rhizophila]|uniref:RNA polymerase sigma factor n=1 Tax=Chitinophaga rhizophila TaxID=2866212 RepID=A0ABS7GIE5_9BACT|nr:RNA polymerase sigma factor [Chitinophaga rhizophila]MBW8686248.1 RNA polymerase sigma factor [Chitinophaga rhizophila]